MKWTEEEVSLLKEKLVMFTGVEVHRKFFSYRSYNSVRHKITEVKNKDSLLKKKSKKYNSPWTKEEIQCLINLGNILTYKELSKKHMSNRTPGAIASKMLRLGITPPKDRREWTEEETVYLRLNYQSQTAQEISAHLNRGVHSIYHMAKNLGLKKHNKISDKEWTKEEIYFLRRKSLKKSTNEIAKILGRTRDSVYYKMRDLGVSPQPYEPTRMDLERFFSDFEENPFKGSRFHKLVEERGFPAYKKGGKWVISPQRFKSFLKKNPELFNIYTAPEELLFEFQIDLESWPEPPVYKIIKCDGWEGLGISHHLQKNYFLLYKKFNFCQLCKKRLTYWADDYCDELPKGYPYEVD